MNPTRRKLTSGTPAVLALSFGLAALGLVIHIASVLPRALPGHAHAVPFIAVIAAFAVAESLVVHFEFRREVHSISMSELPLVLGLLMLPTGHVLIARVLGAAIALVAHRRQLNVKLLFNLANFAAETSVAAAIYLSVCGHHDPFSPLGVAGAFAGVLAGNLVGGCSVIGAISLYESRFQRTMILPVLGAQAVACVANTSMALVAAAVAPRPVAVVLLAGMLALMFAGFRAHGALRQRYAGLELLYGFARSVDGSLPTEDILTVLLTQANELLRSEIGHILLLGDRPGQATIRSLDDNGAVQSLAIDTSKGCDLEMTAIAEQRPLIAPRASKDDQLVRLLSAQGLKDALVVPLRRDSEVVGAFLVGDRLGHVSTFDAEDLKLFETIAAHASAVLENGHLIDRLRSEAASKEHQSLHDSLTGLPNRVLFHREVSAAIQCRVPTAAVMLMDLDRFKEVNDTLGHHVGDSLLIEIARRLQDVLASHGMVARLGGDEFAILLPTVGDTADAETIARLILTTLARPLRVGDLELEVGASIGIAMYPSHADDSSSLLQKADVAMYVAKSSHSGHSVYAADRDQSNARRLVLAAELRAAIEAGDLTVSYQPKADLRTGRICGVEALVRWSHPRFGNVPPDEFIPVAEHTGLMGPLTDFVLNSALRQCRSWADAGFDISVAVNLSARSLADTDLANDVADALRASGVKPDRLVLEITESTIMADPVRTTETLHRLAGMGVSLSIDDFGTGYSSLSYLKRLPVHEVKIDKSFVCNMTIEEDDATIVRSVVDLAGNLRLRVVAEGVEDAATLDALSLLGCDSVQGYFLSKPVPASTLTGQLIERGVLLSDWLVDAGPGQEIGRASCRERV